jgi:Ser/Thr protein kinase RdoA (MazF antagonist)
MNFVDLPSRAQVHRLRQTAMNALNQYPLEVKTLRLLNHGFNTTFGVRTVTNQKFALRLNVNSRRSTAQIKAEMSWLAALSKDTELHLPTPQPNRQGALLSNVYSPDLGRDLPTALFSWLPGKDLGDDATPLHMREVGRVAARLHAHAKGFTLPVGAALSSLEHPLMDSPNHFLLEHPHLTPERREVIDATFMQVERVLKDLFARERPMVLHADLHNWNLKWSRGKLYVFDFDDSGIGLPMQDLAIAAYYLRDETQLETALLEGYQTLAPLPAYSQAEYEAILAGRNLVLWNDLLVNTTFELRTLLPRYAHNSTLKLRHYLETGVYKHDVPGLAKS